MIRVALGAVVAAVAMSSAVMAADLIVEEPIADLAVASYDWTGFYAGAALGGIWGSFDSVSGPATHPMDLVTPLDGSGWMAGVDAGYDWQMDSFILGINGEVNWTNLSAEFVDLADEEFHASLDWYAALTAKAGFAADQIQFYGKAGLAVGGMTLTGVDNVAVTEATATNTNVGWIAGVGAEVAATDVLSIFVEYEHIDLGAADYDITGTGFHAVESMSATADVFKVGLHFRQ